MPNKITILTLAILLFRGVALLGWCIHREEGGSDGRIISPGPYVRVAINIV